MIITNQNHEEMKAIPAKNSSCICCNAERPEGFANDIEKIFWALNKLSQDELAESDSKMCEPHAKKARGLKIFSSKDELFELDPTTTAKQNPLAHSITPEEYNRDPEIEDVKVTM